jgi:tetratricopeptide (TPR) repeat protein
MLLLLLMGVAPQLLPMELERTAVAKTRKPATQPADAARPATAPGSEDCLQVEECRLTFESARRLSDSRQYNAALTGYEKAYSIRPSSWLLINIGRVQQKLGRPAEAITSFNRFLADADQQPAEAVAAAREYLKQAESDVAAARERERQGSQTVSTRSMTAAIEPTAAKAEAKPVYKKWWFWLVLGGATAAVATAVAVGVTAGAASSAEPQHAPFHIAF